MRPYRILVTGSRDWTDREPIRKELSAIIRRVPDTIDGFVLVHGDARGLDTEAAAVAHGMGFIVEPHPADWSTHGKAAGSIRNAHMVGLGADLCLAFPLPGSVGTWDCVRKANAAGIRVIVVPRVRV